MELETLFLVTQIIQSMAVSVFIILLILLLVILVKRLNSIFDKVEVAARESVTAATETKDYINKIGSTILDYFILKIIKITKIDKE